MNALAELAAAVRDGLAGTKAAIREVKMFGGIGFMLDGHMVAAVSKRGLLLRVGQERYAAALARPGARRVEMQGREMRGYVSVDPEILTRTALDAWLSEAAQFVGTLPRRPDKAQPKQKTARKGAKE
jgi:TfoX/Sxy family transcriptional regulator of competence genes